MECEGFLDHIVSLCVVFGGQKQDTVGDRFRYCICRSLPPIQPIQSEYSHVQPNPIFTSSPTSQSAPRAERSGTARWSWSSSLRSDALFE